jgi:hypothetical protein
MAADHIKHIAHTHADKKGLAWCGAALGCFEWSFAGIDHATYNATSGGRLVACPACVEAVAKALASPDGGA